jgi:hypothetical protein
MAKPTASRSSKRESSKLTAPPARESARKAAPDRANHFRTLQQNAGNTAVSELLQRANAEAGVPLDENVQGPLERSLGVSLSGVRVHAGPSSEAAAESLGAKAYTIGSDVHLGPAARRWSVNDRNRLLTHEAIHTVQQGGRSVPLAGRLAVSQPGDNAEREASQIAETISSTEAGQSKALALRAQMRVTPVAGMIQRDIIGDKTFADGSKLEIKFTKQEGVAAGDTAAEDGDIKFTPSATSPASNSIRFVQLARTFDTTTNKEFDWTGSAEANRNAIMTKNKPANNIAGGFYVDQIHASQAKRTARTDPDVLPYYDVTSPGTIGSRVGTTIVPATLHDRPNFSRPLKFSLVTSAKGHDNGVWYGTVLWGFETFLDKAGITKIRNEYRSFRSFQGETTDDALRRFNDFYRNKGTVNAP